MSGLKTSGHDVRVLIYHPLYFFKPFLDERHVGVQLIESRGKVHRANMIRREIREAAPDVVISFLSSPNLIAEFTKVSSLSPFRLLASERIHDARGVTPMTIVRSIGHVAAHKVITNSKSQLEFLSRTAPWLRTKLLHIPNCVDTDEFLPTTDRTRRAIKLCVAASYIERKNALPFLDGFRIACEECHGVQLECDWYGDPVSKEPDSYFSRVTRAISDYGLNDRFRANLATRDIVSVYRHSDCLCLPSLYEGQANAICEAMACGLPILASKRGDNQLMVRHGFNGYLFEPTSPRSIADAIKQFCRLSLEERANFGNRSRKFAVDEFSPPVFLSRWQAALAG
jgi:glycosyltransferase involved in cell wall biosynthesis